MLSCLLALGAHVALAPPTTIVSFEEPTAEWRVVDASATPVSDHVTEGEFALRVEFEQSDGYPALALGAECLALTDWTGYGAVAFDVFVEGDAELGLNVRLDTKAGGVEAMEQTEVRVRPNRATTVSMALPRELPHMYFGPPALLGDVNGALRSADLDLAAVTGIHIFLLRPETARTIYIDNVRLAPEVPMRDLVDRYGQYANAEWPGKITRDEDLTEDRSQETEWLSHNGRPASFDEYGAWADGPQLDATGWFRTAQVDGKWWLVAPNGKLFWSSGLDCVNTQNGGPIRDRQYLFSWLPEPGDALSRFGSAESAEANFYEMNLYRKAWARLWEPWLARTGERLDAWGFNTIAAWSDQTFHSAAAHPHPVDGERPHDPGRVGHYSRCLRPRVAWPRALPLPNADHPVPRRPAVHRILRGQRDRVGLLLARSTNIHGSHQLPRDVRPRSGQASYGGASPGEAWAPSPL